MIKTFTENDILKYLYNDITVEDKAEFEQALLFDNELMETYQEMKSTQKDLDGLQYKPSKRITDDILAFSRLYSPGS